MDESLPVLVLISEDPRSSHRANEALRIALGIAAGENEVTIVLTGPAVHLLDGDTDDLVDGDDIAKYRSTIAKLGIPFHIENSSMPREPGDWNPEEHATSAVSPDEIGELIAGSRRFLKF